MKTQALLTLVAVSVFNFSANAGNNPRIDQALAENLAEKQTLSNLKRDELAVTKQQLNSKYRAVQVLEMGDELGGFVNATSLQNDELEDLE